MFSRGFADAAAAALRERGRGGPVHLLGWPQCCSRPPPPPPHPLSPTTVMTHCLIVALASLTVNFCNNYLTPDFQLTQSNESRVDFLFEPSACQLLRGGRSWICETRLFSRQVWCPPSRTWACESSILHLYLFSWYFCMCTYLSDVFLHLHWRRSRLNWIMLCICVWSEKHFK